MSFRPRPNTITLYRVMFTAMLFLCGIAGVLIYLLEPSAWVSLHAVKVEASGAILAAYGVGGTVCLLYGAMLLYFMADRRAVKRADRRQRQIPLDFPDQRSGVDRRMLEADESDSHLGDFPHTEFS